MPSYLYRPVNLLIALLVCCGLASKATGQQPAARTTNTCGVTAAISPRDTIVPQNTAIRISSTSTGATAFEWYVNGSKLYNYSESINYSFQAGVYQFMLVASNGSCSDTAYLSVLCIGTPHATDTFLMAHYGFNDVNEYASRIDNTPDGGYVLGGKAYIREGFDARPYLLKVRANGCVEWSRIIENPWGGEVSHLLGCADSSLLVVTSATLMRLDKDGNERWKKRYQLAGETAGILGLTEDAAGAIYLLTYNSTLRQGFSVLKLNGDGEVIWSKFYRCSYGNIDQLYPRGITVLDGEVYVSGNNSTQTSSSFRYENFLLKLSAASGASRWFKSYYMEEGTSHFGTISTYGPLLMLSSAGTRTGDKLGHTLLFLDTDGGFHKGLHLTHRANVATTLNGLYSSLAGYAESDAQGNIFLMNHVNQPLYLQPYYQLYSYFAKIDTAMNIKWGAEYSSYPRGQFVHAALNRQGEWAGVGTDYGRLVYGNWSSRNFMFMKIRSPQQGNVSCSYATRAFDFQRVRFQEQALALRSDSVLRFSYVLPQETVNATYSQARFLCPDFIDSCALLLVTGPTRACNLSDTYTYRAGYNRNCSQPVEWQTEGPLDILSRTDSTLTVRFSGFGRYKIAAQLLYTCTPRRDSLLVEVQSNVPPLELGRDTSLCPNNTLLLKAGSRYRSYRWADGSTDSTFTVRAPGSYHVTVTDSCGNTLRDTITVAAAAAVPIDLGPDRTKCNSDTLHLSAPAGFLNYRWSNDYHLSSTTNRSVVVNPLVDTAYYLRAEKTPGCYAYDTVRVTVHTSPPIDLGRDTSFCPGGSVWLRVPDAFSAYQWSGPSTGRNFRVYAPGTYWLRAVTPEGCVSTDTLEVLQVYNAPVVRLDHDSTLCTGTTRTLDAGPYTDYAWQDGSTGQTFTISAPGRYSVTVVDANGCSGTDSVHISRLLPLPQGFLPPDTAICSYGTLVLKPVSAYTKYAWSNGSTMPALTIDRPGRYTLQVTDAYGCTGHDEVVVAPKECMKGLYVPNAFTPNKDGRNDLLRAMLFGPVKSYTFTVYNRWGEAVFRTTDPLRGWDGTSKGKPQDMGVFVWTCRYQLEGEEEKQERGTVVVIR